MKGTSVLTPRAHNENEPDWEQRSSSARGGSMCALHTRAPHLLLRTSTGPSSVRLFRFTGQRPRILGGIESRGTAKKEIKTTSFRREGKEVAD